MPKIQHFNSQDIGKSDANNIDKNHTEEKYTDQNLIHPSIGAEEMEEILKAQIEYDILVEWKPNEKQRVDEFVSIMTDVLCADSDTVRISGNDLPKKRVHDRFMQLSFAHMEYILECMDKNPTPIRNIRTYLLATLYNAPVTMDSYYSALVNYNLYNVNTMAGLP